MTTTAETDRARQYRLRFAKQQGDRSRVWQVLTADFFQRYIPAQATILDLGSGWGEFVNHIQAETKYAMDLNPEGAEHLNPNVRYLNQDCSHSWPFEDNALDLVFTSNAFEHLPAKEDVARTLAEAHRCLKPDGLIICMGPNIKYVLGQYWDFWDHYIPLTEQSLAEVLRLRGFAIEQCWPRFLPYTMVNRRPTARWLIQLYLKTPWLWRLFGKQFLIVARAVKRPMGSPWGTAAGFCREET